MSKLVNGCPDCKRTVKRVGRPKSRRWDVMTPRNAGFGPDYPFRNEERPERSSDPISDHADLLDAVQLLKRFIQKYPDTDLGLKTLDWIKRRQLQGSILR